MVKGMLTIVLIVKVLKIPKINLLFLLFSNQLYSVGETETKYNS